MTRWECKKYSYSSVCLAEWRCEERERRTKKKNGFK